MTSIALIGRSPATRKYIAKIAPETQIYTIAACFNIVPRIDACVEIHKFFWLRHKNYAPEMFSWLKEEHPFPIYTQRRYKAIPASVPYPYADVLELAPMTRGNSINEYFTSSFDYLVALALLARPERIEIIGYDMASDTEYRYQREGASFWLGVAAGMGVDVWLPPECALLEGKLYGFGGAQAIRYERLVKLRDKAQAWFDVAEQDHTARAQSLPEDHEQRHGEPDITAIYTAIAQARDWYFVTSGVLQALDELISRFSLSDVIPRQQLETQRLEATNQQQAAIARVNYWEGRVGDRKERLDNNRHDPNNERIFIHELVEANKQLIYARDEYMTWKGAQQLCDMLVDECDLIFAPDWLPTAATITIDVIDKSKQAATRNS